MTLVNGVLTKPIVVDPAGDNEVGNCIGESSGDWRTLCRSDKINWKSKYKPCENPNVVEEMTDAQFSEMNWGYYISESPVTIAQYRDYINNGTLPGEWAAPDSENFRSIGYGWYYQKPSTWQRILDFHRYNHKTTEALLSRITVPSEVFSDTESMYVDLFKGTFWLTDFGVFTRNNCHLGVIICKQGEASLMFKAIPSESSYGFTKISFDANEIKKVFNQGAGTYRVYAVATADYAQNLIDSVDGYTTQLTIWPLPVDMQTIEYKTASSGTSDNVVNFHINNLDSTYNTLTWELQAYNTTSTQKVAAFIWFHISAVDEYGMTWEMSAPELLQAGPFNVSVPAYGTAEVGEFSERYEAYMYGLAAPWTVILSIYHSNNEEGTDRRGAGTAQFVYEG